MLALSKADQDPPSAQKITGDKIIIDEIPLTKFDSDSNLDKNSNRCCIQDSIDELIGAWRKLKDRRAIDFSYQVQVSYHILRLDRARRQILHNHGGTELIHDVLALPTNISSWQITPTGSRIEASLLRSLTPQLCDLLSIEPNLMQQRQCLEDTLRHDEGCFTMNVPHLLSEGDAHMPIVPPSHESTGPNAAHIRITFNAHDLREARYLHDQLCVLGPIMFVLTANDPGWGGLIVNEDGQSEHNSNAVVDSSNRNLCEDAYLSISSPVYVSADAPGFDASRKGVDQRIFWRLRREGFDDTLATVFARSESSTLRRTRTDEGASKHYNWLDCLANLNPYAQLQPPPIDQPEKGFRVEFSGINTQLTDFAHAACISFVALLRFAILGFDLDFRMSPEKVAENMRRSKVKGAITREKFWWRMPRWQVKDLHPFSNDQYITTDQEPTLVCIDHIVNGDPCRPKTIGLSGVVEAYLADTEDDFEAGISVGEFSTIKCNNTDLSPISNYLTFMRTRAKGTTWTDARWIETFIRGHHGFAKAGMASPEVLYDVFNFVKNSNRSGQRPRKE